MRLHHLAVWHESTLFTEKERATLSCNTPISPVFLIVGSDIIYYSVGLVAGSAGDSHAVPAGGVLPDGYQALCLYVVVAAPHEPLCCCFQPASVANVRGVAGPAAAVGQVSESADWPWAALAKAARATAPARWRKTVTVR